jgi:hypothetical protein
MLTGEKLTVEQMAILDAKKKERDARCEPEVSQRSRSRFLLHSSNAVSL